MATSEPDILWMVKSGNDPWRAVSKEEWVRIERKAGFHNTAGKPGERATDIFNGNGHQGTGVYVEYLGDDSFIYDPELYDAIISALRDRTLDPANAVPHRS